MKKPYIFIIGLIGLINLLGVLSCRSRLVNELESYRWESGNKFVDLGIYVNDESTTNNGELLPDQVGWGRYETGFSGDRERTGIGRTPQGIRASAKIQNVDLYLKIKVLDPNIHSIPDFIGLNKGYFAKTPCDKDEEIQLRGHDSRLVESYFTFCSTKEDRGSYSSKTIIYSKISLKDISDPYPDTTPVFDQVDLVVDWFKTSTTVRSHTAEVTVSNLVVINDDYTLSDQPFSISPLQELKPCDEQDEIDYPFPYNSSTSEIPDVSHSSGPDVPPLPTRPDVDTTDTTSFKGTDTQDTQRFDIGDPYDHDPNAYPALNDSRNKDLQKLLEQGVSSMSYGIRKGVSHKNLALGLVDVTDLSSPKVAFLNEYHMMANAASLPKIALLLGAYQWVADGYAQGTNQDDFSYHVNRMIRNSSNISATWVYNLINTWRYDKSTKAWNGYLKDVLTSPYYGYHLYDQDLGGLWVGKEYGKKGLRIGDPLYNTSQGANPYQVARFYYLLLQGELVSPEASKAMLGVLSNSALNHKFQGALKNRYGKNVTIWRKSGSWSTYHSDCAIVERNNRSYIAVALSNSSNGAAWMGQVILMMDDVIDSFKLQQPDS